MRRRVDPRLLIDRRLRHRTYPVLGQWMRVSPLTIQDNMRQLRHVYCANDRWELELRPTRPFGERQL
jgi:hypothetical protein